MHHDTAVQKPIYPYYRGTISDKMALYAETVGHHFG